jgi:hypothetical protein
VRVNNQHSLLGGNVFNCNKKMMMTMLTGAATTITILLQVIQRLYVSWLLKRGGDHHIEGYFKR